MFKLPKRRNNSDSADSAEDSVTFEGRGSHALTLLKQS